MDSTDKKWTASDVEDVITNPVYAGVGPFPQIVDDATWLTTATKMIKKQGAHKFLSRMLTVLRTSFDSYLEEAEAEMAENTAEEEKVSPGTDEEMQKNLERTFADAVAVIAKVNPLGWEAARTAQALGTAYATMAATCGVELGAVLDLVHLAYHHTEDTLDALKK